MYTLRSVAFPTDDMDQPIPRPAFKGLDAAWARLLSAEAVGVWREHPRFLEAAELAVRGALKLHDTSALNTPHLKDGGRFFAGLLALYLHATGGLTLARLRDLCARTGITSRGRVLAVLSGLRMIGFIEPAPRKGDARVQLYRPTARMVGAFRGRISVELQGCALLSEPAARLLARFEEDAVFSAVMARLGDLLTTPALFNNAPASPIAIFSDRNAGTIILYALLAGGEPGDRFPPRGPVRMSVAGLAGRFKVSRTHVLRLLRDAESQGLLRRDSEGVTGWLEPALQREAELLFQLVFAILDGLAKEVLRDLQCKTGPHHAGAASGACTPA
ncbi:hypothetical protein BH11PSE1_BH11PSE1_14560 [soil metagenome]